MTENSGSSAKPKRKAFSLKCSKLFLWLKLFGLMHVNIDGSEVARSSLGWIVYSYALICVTIAALIFTLLNIEVSVFLCYSIQRRWSSQSIYFVFDRVWLVIIFKKKQVGTYFFFFCKKKKSLAILLTKKRYFCLH